jgi:hypothetical protein
MLQLVRTYTEEGTFGVLFFEDSSILRTVEKPWLDNKPRVSCIPEGVYLLRLRESKIVIRTTKARHSLGWEVTGVPDRSLIMMHIANLPEELEGCIGIGTEFGILKGKKAVLNSSIAFNKLMEKLSGRKEWYLEITSKKVAK